MRIVTSNKQREAFASKEKIGVNDDDSDRFEYYLSPQAEVKNTRRPINRYDSEAELYAAANARNCKIIWQNS